MLLKYIKLDDKHCTKNSENIIQLVINVYR